MTNTVFLLRHGQTEWSESGKHTSRSDIPLTPEGEERARRTGEMLAGMLEHPALVLSSPRERAVRTAELAGLAVAETTEDLAEWDYGEYEGITTAEIRETVPGWTVWTHPTPGGETAEQVTARAERVLSRARAAGLDVVLVGHGHFSRVLAATWVGQDAAYGIHFGLDPAGLVVLGEEHGLPQIKRLNVHP
ncbi:histidine phosphatase family protein [Actinokineospora bangkokensis]|uniref:Acid phosphatase n=1 Tax=Actinokineospora bangkokensis TaxID=1193682 RepID=A0A1Q9LEG6_9PSEU|nr:histidine phosphatase family protein [Actinokineospora bangkokensis]OLR90395.1 acid phosphatase [Actinokineospora bangkokensis]